MLKNANSIKSPDIVSYDTDGKEARQPVLSCVCVKWYRHQELHGHWLEEYLYSSILAVIGRDQVQLVIYIIRQELAVF